MTQERSLIKLSHWFWVVVTALLTASSDAPAATETDGAVRLITLDPGHFHAALFQKEMLPGVSRRVHVYAPCGPDLLAHLGRVSAFNVRAENPTSWELEVHAGPNFFERMLAELPGNVVVISGNNHGKIGRMEAIVGAGLHILADKPWIIEADELPALERTLKLAGERHVVAYDAMTQRYEITCVLQKALVNDPAVFGTILTGTENAPAVEMESVHFIKKEVAGAPLLRPAQFFDARQQGEPLADVGTHLVDLVQWMLSAEKPIEHRRDLAVLRGTHEAIPLTREQFRSVTGLAEFPPFLRDSLRDAQLEFLARNSVVYRLRGIHVKLDVRWEFAAPPGGTDTELSVFRGSRARIEVRQGRAQNFVPEVYVFPNHAAEREAVGTALRARLRQLNATFPGLRAEPEGDGFRVGIPTALRVNHEAHFARLVGEFLQYQRQPHTLPSWEASFLIAKYFVTTQGVRLARQQSAPLQTALSR